MKGQRQRIADHSGVLRSVKLMETWTKRKRERNGACGIRVKG